MVFFKWADGHDTPTGIDTWEHLEMYESLIERGFLAPSFPVDRELINGSVFQDLYYWFLRIFYGSPHAHVDQLGGLDRRFEVIDLDEFRDSKRFFFDRAQRRRAPSLLALGFYVAGHPTGRDACLTRLDAYVQDNREFEECSVCLEMRSNVDMMIFAFCGHRACGVCVYRMPRHHDQRAYDDMIRHRQRQRRLDPHYVAYGEIVPNFHCHVCRCLVKRVVPVFA